MDLLFPLLSQSDCPNRAHIEWLDRGCSWGHVNRSRSRSGCFEAGCWEHDPIQVAAWSFHVSGWNLWFHASILDCRGVETFYLAVTAHTMYVYIYIHTYIYITLPAKFSVCPNFWGRHPAFCSTSPFWDSQTTCRRGKQPPPPTAEMQAWPDSMRRCDSRSILGIWVSLRGAVSTCKIYIYIYIYNIYIYIIYIYTCPQNMALFQLKNDVLRC